MIPTPHIEELAAALTDLLGAENVLCNEPLAAHTTFKIGGPAEIFITPRSVAAIASAVALVRGSGVALNVLGLGSNVLAADEGVAGVVLHLGENFDDIICDGNTIVAQAGASNAQVSDAAIAAGLAGYEFASGIPGTVGGAAIMNAGAYDGEFRDVARSVTCLTPDGEVVELTAEQADWGYRHSFMSDEGYIVLSATLELHPDDPAAIQARVDELTRRREEKQPLELPSAGSTFKRPVGYYAGKLIQDAGMRGHTVGGAQVSTKHAGFVVNAGGATAADVRAVIADVQARVFEDAGVRLEPEVRMWD